jgi:tryptophan-rich sensory protein
MNDLNTLASLGLTLPTPAYLIWAILFGIIGIAAYRFGKKTSRSYPKWIGFGLMLYPYAVSQTWMLYVVGIGLCVALYFLRE